MSQRPYQGGGGRPGQEVGWVPKTKLGKLVQAGEIVSMEEIFTQGMRTKEPEIVDTLLPNIQQEVLGIGFVQKQTDAGERSRFRAIVAVGNGDGYIGVCERLYQEREDCGACKIGCCWRDRCQGSLARRRETEIQTSPSKRRLQTKHETGCN